MNILKYRKLFLVYLRYSILSKYFFIMNFIYLDNLKCKKNSIGFDLLRLN